MKIVSDATDDSPPTLCTLKYTVRMPTPCDSVNLGAVAYGCQAAPTNEGDSLARYSVAVFVTALFNVAARSGVVASPLLIAKEATNGVSLAITRIFACAIISPG